ncbi:VCBS repeat-containing protein [Myxococcota bacterium]|nr:VCBS repeat-containing protein [Myxococcota bacterium]
MRGLRRSLLLFAGGPGLACAQPAAPPSPPASAPRFAELPGAELRGDAGQALKDVPFDALAADMDRDGDEDLVVNRHLRGLLLFEARDGQMVLLNADGRDEAGLDEPPGVRSLAARRAAMDAVEGPAVVVWQDASVATDLLLRLRGPERGAGPHHLRVQTHDRLELVEGQGAQVESERSVSLPFPRKGRTETFRLRAQSSSPRWTLDQLDPRQRPAPVPVDFVVGEDRDRFAGPGLDWWCADPHGMAWGQLTGSPEPELFVVRGGNLGAIQETEVDKQSSLFLWAGAAAGRYRWARDAVPVDPRRGRAAEWVDVDNDDKLDLFVSNRDGPALLLIWDEQAGRFEDRAAVHGLEQPCGETSAWVDLDQDGWQDLVAWCGDRVEVAHNLGVGAFVVEPGADWGLVPAPVGPPAAGWLREESIQVLDLDGDDDLDLLFVGLGRDHRVRALLQGEVGFTEGTADLGLGALVGVKEVRSLDADMDGYLDLLVGGDQAGLLWFRPGQGFVGVGIDALVEVPAGAAARDPQRLRLVPVQADGEGRLELFLGGGGWSLARNATPGPATTFTVRLDAGSHAPPVGTLLRATWADGHRQRVRYGSHARSFLSQALADVVLGLPAPGALTALEVQWPGDPDWTPVPLPPDATGVVLPVPAPEDL